MGDAPQVVEVMLAPAAGTLGEYRVVLEANAPESEAQAEVTVDVVETDLSEGREQAKALMETFLDHVERAHPELRLDRAKSWQREWRPSPQSQEVHHRAYLSDEWEMTLSWHVVGPDDWATAYLRRRGDWSASWAGRLESMSRPAERVLDTALPEQLTR